MTFSTEFRCYIGNQILSSWGMMLAGLLPSWPATLGHNAVAHDVMSLTPWVTVMSAARYGPTAGDSYRREPRRYVPDAVGHDDKCIILQNFERTICFSGAVAGEGGGAVAEHGPHFTD
jgi:hypothetical protein